MADHTFFAETVDENAEPINMVVSTTPGIGTLALLQTELTARGSRFLRFAAHHEAMDLAFRSAFDRLYLAVGLESADTLIVDDMANLTPSFEALLHELVQHRTVRGHKLRSLKNIVLVYQRFDGEPVGPDLIDMATDFGTVRITR